MTTPNSPLTIEARAARREMEQILEELKILDRFPAAVEYLDYVMRERDPRFFYTARERMKMRLSGHSVTTAYCELPLLDEEIRKGYKMGAIKWLRGTVAMDLKEAKDFVEARAQQIGFTW